jgi:hypothetical protein
MGKNKNEFAAIVEANPGNCAIAIKRTDDDFWFIVLTVISTSVANELLTARGTIKSWRNPADAIEFLQAACPSCEQVTLEVGSWSFVRQLKD